MKIGVARVATAAPGQPMSRFLGGTGGQKTPRPGFINTPGKPRPQNRSWSRDRCPHASIHIASIISKLAPSPGSVNARTPFSAPVLATVRWEMVVSLSSTTRNAHGKIYPCAPIIALALWNREHGECGEGIGRQAMSTKGRSSSSVKVKRPRPPKIPHIPKEGICGPRIIKGRPFLKQV